MNKFLRAALIMILAAVAVSAIVPAPAAAKSPITIQVQTSRDFLATNSISLTLPYRCQYLGQSPADGTHFAPKREFDMIWKVKNIGSKPWKTTEIDYGYVGGTHMEQYVTRGDIKSNVTIGGKYNVVVDMMTPKLPGMYWTSWALKYGAKNFCNFDVTIYVD